MLFVMEMKLQGVNFKNLELWLICVAIQFGLKVLMKN